MEDLDLDIEQVLNSINSKRHAEFQVKEGNSNLSTHSHTHSVHSTSSFTTDPTLLGIKSTSPMAYRCPNLVSFSFNPISSEGMFKDSLLGPQSQVYIQF